MEYILFTTATCPKCPQFKAYVKEEVDFYGDVIDNTTPLFGDKIAEYDVKAAPTIIISDEGVEKFRTSDLRELEGYLKG